MNRRFEIKSLVAITALFAAVLAAGCGQNQSTNPVAAEFTGQPLSLPAEERPDKPTGLVGQELPGVTVTVSASEGGVVAMGRFTLEFPPGALSADTPITMRMADPVLMQITLEPHGLQFLQPVRLSSDVSDIVSPLSETVGIAWLNEEEGKWEVVGEGPAAGGVAEAWLWHFSNYQAFDE